MLAFSLKLKNYALALLPPAMLPSLELKRLNLLAIFKVCASMMHKTFAKLYHCNSF